MRGEKVNNIVHVFLLTWKMVSPFVGYKFLSDFQVSITINKTKKDWLLLPAFLLMGMMQVTRPECYLSYGFWCEL